MSATQASAYLRELLAAPGPYRQRWLPHATVRTPGATVNESAVCHVLAHHLWDSGEVTDQRTDLPRRLRDRVGRALAGGDGHTVLTRRTLRWFIEAFAMSDADARVLGALYDGSANARVVVGSSPPFTRPRDVRHRTRALHEQHYLGADRLPAWHRTTQVIEALDDGLATHLYAYDADALTVDVEQGGDLRGDQLDLGGGLFGSMIRLTRPLNRGETTTLVYTTRFRYRLAPPPEFRRGAGNRVERVDLRVEFHPDALPAQVYFASWPLLAGAAPQDSRPVPIEPDHSVHHFLEVIEHTIVGFWWRWDAPPDGAAAGHGVV